MDLLGYGSFLASTNPSKKAITASYLGLTDVDDADNPLVYKSSQVVNLLPLLAYQKVYFDFSVILNGKNIWPILIMLIIGMERHS